MLISASSASGLVSGAATSHGRIITRMLQLTAAQLEIWLTCQLDGPDASRAHNESVTLTLWGPLDEPALRQALEALAERHEVLRATCGTANRALCILAESPAELAYEDVSAAPAAERRAAQVRHATQSSQHVFNLVTGPLWQPSLLKISDTKHLFTFTAHHIICDLWSLRVVLQDLGHLYSAHTLAAPAGLPPAPPFAHYVAAEAHFWATPAYRAAEDYWRAQFADGGPPLALPTDTPRASRRTYRSARLGQPLAPSLVAGLRATSRPAAPDNLTVTLLAVFEIALQRATGQTDLVVGFPHAGQPAAGTPALVGQCVHVLPLRSRPLGHLPFRTYLAQRRAELATALAHGQISYGSLLRHLTRQRLPGELPLVSVLFQANLEQAGGARFANLSYNLHTPARIAEKFELVLTCSGEGDNLTLECAYNTYLFSPERIQQLLADYALVARQVVAQPTIQLADLHPPAPVA